MTTRIKTPSNPTTKTAKPTLKVKTTLKAGCLGTPCLQHNEKLLAKRPAKPSLKVKTNLKAGCLSGCFQHNEKLIAKR